VFTTRWVWDAVLGVWVFGCHSDDDAPSDGAGGADGGAPSDGTAGTSEEPAGGAGAGRAGAGGGSAVGSGGEAGRASWEGGAGGLDGVGGVAPGGAGEAGAGEADRIVPSLTTGTNLTCWLNSDGAASCWGDDSFGQVSETTGRFTALSVGLDDHVCGLRPDGGAVCWGDDTWGQSTPPDEPFRSIASGTGYTCAIRLDRSITCWGTLRPLSPEQLAAPLVGEFKSVSVGEYLCGIRTDDSLACAGAPELLPTPEWAKGKFRSIAPAVFDVSCGVRFDGELTCFGNIDWAPTGQFTQVVVGFGYACGLRDNGVTDCSDGALTRSSAFLAIAAGSSHACALTPDGSPVCWGENRFGAATTPGSPFVEIHAGDRHFCGLRADQTLSCWGWDEAYDSPAGQFARVYCGGPNTCAYRANGDEVCLYDPRLRAAYLPQKTVVGAALSSGVFCQIGADNSVDCATEDAYASPAGPGARAVSASPHRACVIQATGALSCALFAGGTSLKPFAVPAGVFTALSITDAFGCALRADKTLACWGDDAVGQASPPAGEFQSVVTVEVSSYVSPTGRVAYYACGLRSNGDVSCWGDPYYALSQTGPFTAIAAGSERICALEANGTVHCWGPHPAVADTPIGPDGRFREVVK